MLGKQSLGRNIASNWAGYVVQVTVAFVLMPFVVHSLGETHYGIWTLVVGLTGYYGLLDLGVASGMTQYLTRYLAANDIDKLNRSVSAGFVALSGIGFLVFIGSLAVAFSASSLFQIQAVPASEVTWVLAITGTSVAMQFVFFPYSAVFTAVQRFDLSNVIGISTRILSAGATVICLNRGYGLVGLSLVVAGTNLIDYLIRWRVARRLLPAMKISPKLANAESLREVISFGVWNFVSAGSARLISYTDALVIAAFMPVAAVAPFAIAANLRSYFDDIFVRVGYVFGPRATELDAKQDHAGLRKLYLVSSRFMLLGAIVCGSIAMFSARDFFRLWVGTSYAEPTGYPSVATIFYVLMAGSMVAVAQRIGYQVLLGTRRVKLLALLFAVEGVSNLVISLALVRTYGLVGVALGTLIPATMFQGVLQPVFVCQSLQIPLNTYCREVLLKPTLVLGTLVPLLLLAGTLMPSGDWASLVSATYLMFAVTVPLVFLVGLTKVERDSLVRYPATYALSFLSKPTILKSFRQARDTAVRDLRAYQLRRAFDAISSLSPNEFPRRRVIRQLWRGWGNRVYSGHIEYLEEVIRRAATSSTPVLECGSGLTTILLGLFAARRGVRVLTLEHDPEWYEHTAAALRLFRIEGVELVLAPLRNYGEFSWYDVPIDRMPHMFGMIVCDGPPKKTTPGDRYGLLQVIKDRVGAGTVILFDDVWIPRQDPVLSRWLGDIPASVDVFTSDLNDSYAVVVLE
jgi:O-antigen/teichoic acid export membrane protein